MLWAFISLVVLWGAWFVRRTPARAGEEETHLQAASDLKEGRGSKEQAVGAALLLIALYPLLRLTPWIGVAPDSLFGDAEGHARVALDLSRGGLTRGWIESYLGGFPFGHHYPPLGWLLLAGSMRLGAAPQTAVYVLGWLACVSLPVVFYWSIVRMGARAPFAAAGAALISWTAPHTPFISSYETFFHTGLISQAVATPICVWWVASILRGRCTYEPAIAGALAMASHPQVTVATAALLFVGIAFSANRDLLLRWGWGVSVLVIFGACLYGQGLTSLDFPFGWPPGVGWRQVGFGPERLLWWVRDGDLLDKNRAGVLTTLAVASFVTLLPLLRHPIPRATAGTFALGLALSVSGQLLAQLGALGNWLLSFLQPLRLLALLPLLAACVVVAALQESAPRLSRAFSNRSFARTARSVPEALAVSAWLLLLGALPSRLGYVDSKVSELHHASNSPRSFCPPGYDGSVIGGWLSGLSGGSLWHEGPGESPLGKCLTVDGLVLESSVPLARTNAVGAHVGMQLMASGALAVGRPGASERARALGIAHVLHSGQPLGPGWETKEAKGKVRLETVAGSTGVASAGCITRAARGQNQALRRFLQDELRTTQGADAVLNLETLVAVEVKAGAPLSIESQASPCSTKGTTVSARPLRSGEIEVQVSSPSAFDLVIHQNAFPSWRVTVDEQEAATTMVAPGFLSVRVPKGEHVILAQGGTLDGYLWIVISGVTLLAAAAHLLKRRVPSGRETRRKA